jgi:hypothetical protein
MSLTCPKCNGTGTIIGFSHVSAGRCFRCNGAGSIPEPKRMTIGYARAFVEQYAGAGFFPEDQSSMTRIVRLSTEDHPTAEKWLMRDASHFYVGQPVCRSSIWYKVPESEFEAFLKHYNKGYKLKIKLNQ